MKEEFWFEIKWVVTWLLLRMESSSSLPYMRHHTVIWFIRLAIQGLNFKLLCQKKIAVNNWEVTYVTTVQLIGKFAEYNSSTCFILTLNYSVKAIIAFSWGHLLTFFLDYNFCVNFTVMNCQQPSFRNYNTSNSFNFSDIGSLAKQKVNLC